MIKSDQINSDLSSFIICAIRAQIWILNPFDTRKMMASNKKNWTQWKTQFCTTYVLSKPDSLPDEVYWHFVSTLTHSPSGQCIWIERATTSSWKNVSVYWHLVSTGLRQVTVLSENNTNLMFSFDLSKPTTFSYFMLLYVFTMYILRPDFRLSLRHFSEKTKIIDLTKLSCCNENPRYLLTHIQNWRDFYYCLLIPPMTVENMRQHWSL